ncbi:uncharacterized protein EDB93DRAFT_208640 [Suillus bovinus]|uniref:uncharacterized protein n=1 Tax=Suillus bovinus TaxID=48563 RepID=UPI001B85CC2D|nr:uncharacterized protein EDB93DRAFT_208640 [Suillus bovinus]KAG2153671.1 hypothetical protein EDB93DRAFT_208640 [Suillus bovinus]
MRLQRVLAFHEVRFFLAGAHFFLHTVTVPVGALCPSVGHGTFLIVFTHFSLDRLAMYPCICICIPAGAGFLVDHGEHSLVKRQDALSQPPCRTAPKLT